MMAIGRPSQLQVLEAKCVIMGNNSSLNNNDMIMINDTMIVSDVIMGAYTLQ